MGGWLLALVLAVPPAPVAKPAPAPPVLEGIVKGPDGKPLENALVAARPSSAEPLAAAITARTDSSGRFKLKLTSAGLHTVRVEAKGLAGRTLEKVRPGASLDVVLQKGGAVEGTVRDAATGQAVPGARVEAHDQAAPSLPWEADAGLVRTTTDDKGRYRLEGLGPGLHTLSASAKNYGRARRTGVTAGRTVDLLLLAGAAVRGTVSGPDRKPVQGALVRAEPEAGRWFSTAPTEVTNGAGRFEILGLEPGTLRLVVRHPRLAPAVAGGISVERGSDAQVEVVMETGIPVVGRILGRNDRPTSGDVGLVEINADPTPPTLVDLLRAQAGPDGRFRLETVPPGEHALQVSAPGYGRKRVDVSAHAGDAQVDLGDISLEAGLTIRGRVRDKAGTPIADAQLSGFPMRSEGSEVEGRTETDGSFALGGLGPGSYRVTASAPGFGEAGRTAEAGSENVEIVLQPAGLVTGVVVDEAGRPVEAYRVSAQPADPEASMGFMMPPMKDVASPDGRFVLDDVAEGTYVVSVVAPERASATVSGVKVTPGVTSDVGRIRLGAGGTVRGIVVDSGGGPVGGATVTVRGPGRDYLSFGLEPQAVSDSAGAFEVKGAPVGRADVVANHPDFAGGRATGIEVDPVKGPAEARIVLSRGGRVEGWVRKRDGTGIPGTTVRASSVGAGGGISFGPSGVRTRDDGSFVLEHVLAGRTRVMVMTEAPGGRLVRSKEIDVREAETVTVEFIQRDILVSGRVTRSGAVASGLRVRLRNWGAGVMHVYGPGAGAPTPTSGPERMTAVTREDGSYEMLVDEPGRYSVNVASLDDRINLPDRFVDIPDADAHTLNLSYAGAILSGLVVDKENERPLIDVDVYAKPQKPEGSSGGSASTGPDGRFQLELEPGEYKVAARTWEEGYGAAETEVTLGASEAEIRFALTRGLILSGKVVDAGGRGVAGVSVTARAGEGAGRSFGFARTLPDGSFKIGGLAAESHTVVASYSDQGAFGVRTGVVPGDKDVILALRPGGRVRLQVQASDGLPVDGAFATLVKISGIPAGGSGARTDAQGIAEFAVPAGTVEIRVTKETLEARVTVSVGEGGSAAATVKLGAAPPGGTP